jgi:hypothetical protein
MTMTATLLLQNDAKSTPNHLMKALVECYRHHTVTWAVTWLYQQETSVEWMVFGVRSVTFSVSLTMNDERVWLVLMNGVQRSLHDGVVDITAV